MSCSVKHVFTLETHDAYGFPYPTSQIPHTKLPITLTSNNNGTYTILFRNFNFTTYDLVSDNNYDETVVALPPGGFLTTYSNPLPECMRPKEEQTWILPANDAYLQNFSYSNPNPPNIIFDATVSADLSSLIDVTNINSLVVGQPVSDNSNSTLALGTVITAVDYVNNIVTLNQPANGPGSSSYTAGNFPTPLPGLIVSINPYGKLSIFANGTFAMTIPPGPHTLLATTVTLVPDDSCKVTPPKNFIIESRFSDVSQFVGNALFDGIRDTHVNDTFEDVVAYSWVGNPVETAEGEQALSALNLFVCIGKIQPNGKVILGPVQQLTNYQPLPTINFNAIATNGSANLTNVTNINSLIVGQLVVDNNTVNPSVPPYTVIISIDNVNNIVTLSADAIYSTITSASYTASQFPGNSTTVFDSAIAINRKDKKFIAVSWVPEDVNDFVFATMVIISTDGGMTWNSPQIVPSPSDPYYPYMTAIGLGGSDCRGVIADKFGNFIYNCTIYLNDNYPIGAVVEVIFFISSDFGTTWKTIFISDQSGNSGGVFQFDYPQMSLGYAGPGLGYGLSFATDLTTFYNPEPFDLTTYLGFIPLSATGAGTPQFIKMNLVNVVNIPCMTQSNDGTLFISYSSGTTNTSPALLVKVPPNTTGVLDASLVQGPFTNFQHANDYLQAVASFPLENLSYFTLTVQGFIYDNHRKALYVIINQQPTWYDSKTGDPSQNFDQFMVISTDEGVTWSQKFPIASTIKNNRGYASMAFNEKNKSIYIGFYDSRNSPGSVQIQYFGVTLSSKKLDRWVKIAKES